MSATDPYELRLPLTADETELLRRAARADGIGDLSAWARRILLEAAGPFAAEDPTGEVAPPKKKPNRPKCGCGGTASPNGECDGSCIMRF